MPYVIGTNTDNILTGGAGNDVLIGYGGADRLDGGAGNDILLGGPGNDIFVFRPGDGMDAIADADAGDVLVVEDGPIFDLNWLQRDGTDLLISFADNGGYVTDPANTVRVINHFAGSALRRVEVDTFVNATYGPELSFASFTVAGGPAGSNQGNSAEVIFGNTGNDTITTGGGFWDMVIAGAGDDRIVVTTGTQSSLIRPDDGNDTIIGAEGNDTIRGSRGYDYIDGGGGIDVVDFRDSDSGVTVNLSKTTVQYVGSYDGGDVILNVENVWGSRFNNSIAGNAAANILVGRDGRDTLDGGAGADTLEGGHDNDTYVVDNAADVVRELPGAFGGGDEVRATVSYTLSDSTTDGFVERLTLLGTAASGTGNRLNNQIQGNASANTLSGLGGNDALYGKGGNDTLLGGDGNDRLVGGAGVDSMTGGAGNDRFEYIRTADSGVGLGNRDVITDFATGDLIDLRRVDAIAATPLDDAFTFIGAAAFTAAGQVRTIADTAGLIIAVNTDADADAEMEILLAGYAGAFGASDLLL